MKHDTIIKIENNNRGWHSNQNKDASNLTKQANHWQCSKERILSLQEWRLFIKEYQSSPTEIIVSAINEKANKDNSKESVSLNKLQVRPRENLSTTEDDAIEEDGAV